MRSRLPSAPERALLLTLLWICVFATSAYPDGNAAVRGPDRVTAWNQLHSTWTEASLPGVTMLVGTGENFAAIGSDRAVAWNRGNSSWHDLVLAGAREIVGSGGNFAVRADDRVAAWNPGGSAWVERALEGALDIHLRANVTRG